MGTEPTLRLLMTADAVGGVWNYALDLLRCYSERGIASLLAVMGPAPSSQQLAEATGIPGVEVQYKSYALEWMQNPWADVDAAGRWLLRLESEFRPNLVHLNGFSHARLQFQCPVVVVAHSCVYTWWRAVHGTAPGPEWTEYRTRVSRGLERADAIVAPTRAFASAIENEYGLAAGSVRPIHNFSAAGVSPVRASKQPFCLASGRFWDRAKNLELLAAIAAQLRWPVKVAGSTAGPESETSRSDVLEYLGQIPHLDFLAHLDSAAIFLHPAVYEPFGLAVLEAARRSCCLILSDVPSLRELWEDAAVFLPGRDARAWCDAINALIGNPEKRARLGQRARLRASGFTATRTVNAYMELYGTAMKLKSRAHRLAS